MGILKRSYVPGKEIDMKLLKKKESKASYNEKYLLDEIAMTKAALETAYSNFDNVTEPDLIDCYIYRVNAEQKRYKYLLKLAKEQEIL